MPGFLSPVVANSVSFKVEQEVNSDSPDVIRLLPTLELGFKGRYWDAKAGSKRTYENSDELGKNPKTTDSHFLEVFYLAPKSVPDLKAKYTIDIDSEAGHDGHPEGRDHPLVGVQPDRMAERRRGITPGTS